MQMNKDVLDCSLSFIVASNYINIRQVNKDLYEACNTGSECSKRILEEIQECEYGEGACKIDKVVSGEESKKISEILEDKYSRIVNLSNAIFFKIEVSPPKSAVGNASKFMLYKQYQFYEKLYNKHAIIINSGECSESLNELLYDAQKKFYTEDNTYYCKKGSSKLNKKEFSEKFPITKVPTNIAFFENYVINNNLNAVFFYYNKLINISPLKNLSNLVRLDLDSNEIYNLYPISSLKKLTFLTCQFNKITDIEAISNLTNLKTLILANNKIKKIEVLPKLTNLGHLNIDENKIEVIPSILSLVKIENLYIKKNPIKKIAKDSKEKLWEFECKRENCIDLEFKKLIHNCEGF